MCGVLRALDHGYNPPEAYIWRPCFDDEYKHIRLPPTPLFRQRLRWGKPTTDAIGERALESTERSLSYPTSTFRDPDDLDVGDAIHYYTQRSNGRMGGGVVVEYVQGSWGTAHIPLTHRHSTRGLARGLAVQLNKACIPSGRSAVSRYKYSPKSLARSPVGDLEGKFLLLWIWRKP